MSDELAVQQSGQLAKPSYLPEMPADERELSKRYSKPSFLVIIQKQGQDEDIEKFGVGSIVIKPDGVLVMKKDGEPVPFTPLAFYVEFIKWIPKEANAGLMAEYSRDENSEIAKRCRDPERRLEVFPGTEERKEGPLYYSYIEHLNFIVKVDGFPMPVIMGFSKTAYKTGQRFFNLITMRQAPMCACRFAFKPGRRENAKGQWLDFDIDNYGPNPWVPQEEFESLQTLSEEFKKLIRENAIESVQEVSPEDSEPQSDVDIDDTGI